MNPAWKTAEFWAAMVSNLVGALVLLGIVTPEQQNALVQGASQLAGSLLIVIPTLVTIVTRASTRKAVAVATIAAVGAPAPAAGNGVSAMGLREDAQAIIARIQAAIKALDL